MKKIKFDQLFLNSIAKLRKKDLYRNLKSLKRIDAVKIKYKKRTLLNFSSNDYLGLSQDKRIKNDTIKLINKYGIGSGSSRLVSGNYDFHEKIEKELARKKKSEAALVPSISEPFKTNQHLLEWQERGAYNWQPPKTGKLPPLKGSMPTCPAYEFSFLLTKRF